MNVNYIKSAQNGTPKTIDLLLDGNYLHLFGARFKYTNQLPLKTSSDGTFYEAVIALPGEVSVSGDVPFNNHRITSLGSPLSGTDAANKQFVIDTVEYVSGAVTGDSVQRSGDTMYGDLNFTGGSTIGGVPNPFSLYQVANKAYVDHEVANVHFNIEPQNSAITRTLLTPPISPANNDRYLLSESPLAGAWVGHDDEIAEYNSVSGWMYTAPTIGMWLLLDDELTAVYSYSGSWIARYFELTTASGYLAKTGFDVTLKYLPNNKILIGDSFGLAQNGNVTGDVTFNWNGSGIDATINSRFLKNDTNSSIVDGVRYRYGLRQTYDNLTDKYALVTKDYVDSRSGSGKSSILFSGGGRVEFISTTLFWTDQFLITDAFFATAYINSGSIAVADNQILYTKLYSQKLFSANATAGGLVSIDDTTGYVDNDHVVIGDYDTGMVSGFVFGTPTATTLVVDDGLGTPLNLSAYTLANRGWIQKTNLAMMVGTQNNADLKPNAFGELDREIFLIGERKGNDIITYQGEVWSRYWVYEESALVTTEYNFGSVISLPADTRNGNLTKTYQNGRGELQMFVNGFKWTSAQLLLTGTFVPTYNSGTGQISVVDGVDLSYISPEDIFRDASNNEFVVRGGINNTNGAKKFFIDPAQTVNGAAGAVIFKQEYKETGSASDFVSTVIARKKIPVNAIITFRVEPRIAIQGQGGVGGGGSDLQAAYSSGNVITIIGGVPMTLNGPPGNKLLTINGDMEVTGVIDPKGITFTRQSTAPFTGQDGMWINDDGHVVYKDADDAEQIISNRAEASSPYVNSTGSTLIGGRVVRKDGSGSIAYANKTTDAASRAIGILSANTLNLASGDVYKNGTVPVGVITAACFVENALPADNSRIWLATNGQMTITPPVVASGETEIIIGIWDSGALILQITFLGVA